MKTLTRLSILAIAIGLVALPIRARSTTLDPAPVKPAASDQADSSASDEDGVALQRRRDLISGAPDFKALRLDASGKPIAWFDLYFGRGYPASRTELYSILDSFALVDESSDGEHDGTHGSETSTTILLPLDSLPLGPTALGFFDPQIDMAIEFGRIAGSFEGITCSKSFGLTYAGSLNAWEYFYLLSSDEQIHVYYVDGVTAAAGPDLYSDSDPDLYLYRWNNGLDKYVKVATSNSSSTIDSVAYQSSNCTDSSFYVKGKMKKSGAFTVKVNLFNAS
jgi:hypothetical protein